MSQDLRAPGGSGPGLREAPVVIASYQQMRQSAEAQSLQAAAATLSSPSTTASNVDAAPRHFLSPLVRKIGVPSASPDSTLRQQHLSASTARSPSSGDVGTVSQSVMEKELDRVRSHVTRVEGENLNLIREMTQWKLSEETRLANATKALQAEIDTLKQKLVRVAEDKRHELQALSNFNDEALASASTRDKSLISSLERRVAAYETELSQTRSHLVTEIEAHANHRETSKSEVQSLQGRIDGLEAILHDKQSELDDARKLCEATRQQVEAKTVNTLRLTSDTEKLRSQLEFAHEELRRRDRDIANATDTISDLQGRLQKLKATSDAQSSTITETESLAETVVRERQEAEAKMSAALSSSKEELERTQDRVRDLQEVLDRQTQALAETREREDTAQSMLRKKTDELRQTLVRFEEEKASRAHLESHIQRLDEELSRRSADQLTLSSQLASERHSFDAKQSSWSIENRALKEALRDATSAVSRAEQELKDKDQQLDITEHKLRHFQELTQRNSSLEAKLSETEFLLKSATESRNDISQQYDQAIRKIAMMEREAASQQDAFRDLTSLCSRHQEDLRRSTEEIASLRELAAELGAWELRCRELESASVDKHEAMQMLTVAYEELRHECQRLQDELRMLPQLEQASRQAMIERQSASELLEKAEAALKSETEAVNRINAKFEAAASRVQSLEMDVSRLESEVAAASVLKRRLTESSEARQALEVQCAQLAESLRSAEAEKMEWSQRSKQAKETASTATSKTQQLEAHVARLEARVAELQTSLGRSQVVADDAVKASGKLKVQNEGLHAEVLELKKATTLADERAARTEANLDSTQRLYQASQADLTKLKYELQSYVFQLEEAHQLSVSLSTRLERCEEAKSLTEAKLVNTQALEARVKAQQATIEVRTKEVESLREECDKLRDRVTSSDVEQSIKGRLEAAIAQERKSHAETQHQLMSAQQGLADAGRRASLLESECAAHVKEMKRLNDTIQLERSKSDSRLHEIESLETQLRSKAALEGRTSALERINEEQRAQLTQLRQQLTEAALLQAQRSPSDSESSLEAALVQSKSLLSMKEAAVQSLEEDIEKKQRTITQLRSDVLHRETESARLTEQLEEFRRLTNRLTMEKDELQAKLRQQEQQDASQTMVMMSPEESQRLTVRVVELERSNRLLDERCKSLSVRLQGAEGAADSIRSQLQAAHVAHSKSDLDLQITSSANREMKSEVDNLRTQLVEARNQCARLIASLNDRDRAIRQLQERHAEDLSSRDADVSALAHTIDDLRTHVSARQMSAERESALQHVISGLKQEVDFLRRDQQHVKQLSPVRL